MKICILVTSTTLKDISDLNQKQYKKKKERKRKKDHPNVFIDIMRAYDVHTIQQEL